MLLSAHQNANTWYLFMGDRGVIDTVLNKSMLSFTGQRRPFAIWLRFANLVQLLAMTYVAAQKGFDGVFLLGTMLYTRSMYGHGCEPALGKAWLDEEHISIGNTTFRFTGRMPLMGAVYMLSNMGNWSWMDSIISKCIRRDALLQNLRCQRSHTSPEQEECSLKSCCALKSQAGEFQSWVDLNTRLALAGFELIVST
jgi:hypothetical protein